MRYKIFVSVFMFFIIISNAYAYNYKIVRGLIDVHSSISDGKYSLEKNVELAKLNGIDVLIFCDSALRKWEYGLWPLRNLIKKTVEENSVFQFGLKKYFQRFDTIKKNADNLIIVAGLEVSPFYYWKGNPLSKEFSINDWNKRFLIMGLNQGDYQNIPIVGNRQFFYFSKNSFFPLWPTILVILGIVSLQNKKLGIFLIVIGILFLANNLPFPTSRFNQYNGFQDIKPYQELIDYVNKKGGLIFWAHPETDGLHLQRYFGIEAYTPAYSEDLILTKDYTGFGVTYVSLLKMTEAGDIWDKLILEYIEGKRKKPAWIIGAIHYDEPTRKIDAVETVFFVKETSERDILDALREGRMYVRFNLGNQLIVLEEFRVKKITTDSAFITFRGKNPASEPFKIELIRDGKIFKSLDETKSDWEVMIEDNLSATKKQQYYRLKISSQQALILSNPVFVE